MKIGLPVLEKIFEGFYHIWAWRPSWSCDPDAANKISFPLPKEAPHKIWLLSEKRFLRRRRCLKLFTTTDGRTTTDAGPWVYYKLPYETLAHLSKKCIGKGTQFRSTQRSENITELLSGSGQPPAVSVSNECPCRPGHVKTVLS